MRHTCTVLALIAVLALTGCARRRTEEVTIYQLVMNVRSGHTLTQSDVTAVRVPPLPKELPVEADKALLGNHPILGDEMSKFIGRTFVSDVAVGATLQEEMFK